MKKLAVVIGTFVVLGLCGVGCGQSDSGASATEQSATDEVVVEEVSVQETVAAAADTAKQVLDEANTQAQQILTQAQALVGEKKYEEASNLLQKLTNLELTPEQQKMLDDLKVTIQKAVQSEAVKQGTKAIGNMLGGEKQ